MQLLTDWMQCVNKKLAGIKILAYFQNESRLIKSPICLSVFVCLCVPPMIFDLVDTLG
jgi:hypothetical protein